jgi:Ni/Co efflux regulator RcnB
LSYRNRYFRFDGGRYYARNRFSIGVYIVPRGYSYRVWRVGEYLPYSYYDGGRYELHDYWRYDLYEPPYWARWVRVGANALLIDVDSGEVIEIVYDLFY